MELIPEYILDYVFYKGLCPFCKESSTQDDMEIIKPTKKLNYSICKLCLSAFRLSRRKMRHPEDLYYYEIWYEEGEARYAVKGYHISNRTFLRNSYKININQSYSDFFISKDEFSIIE